MATETTIRHQPVFPDNKAATNMPFFDGSSLVFCRSTGTSSVSIRTTGDIWKRISHDKVLAERLKNLPSHQKITYRPWKLAYANWNNKTIRKIHTGLPDNQIERTPAIYKDGGKIHLSFTAGGPTTEGFRYRLFTCSGSDLESLEPPRPVFNEPTYFGFVSPYHICWGIMNVIYLKEKSSGKTFRFKINFHRVSNVTFLADNPAQLLITGLIDRQHRYTTILYDLSTKAISEVLADGPIYKSSIHGGQLVFSQKKKGDFEDRELCQGEYSLSASKFQILEEK